MKILDHGIGFKWVKTDRLPFTAEIKNDDACSACGHTYYDHQGRFTEEERARIMKHRVIGCRVVRCGCENFKTPWMRPVNIFDDNEVPF